MEICFNQADVLSAVYSEVARRFEGSHDLAHGWDHVSRVYALAQHIAECEGADHFIVGMAALMHDLGQTIEHKGATHHVDHSVALASELFMRYSVPEDQREAICHAITAHSFSHGAEPRTLEACVVRDADRLDALGAIGIMRWGIVGAQRRAAHPYIADDPFCEQRTPDDRQCMLDHFYVKLLKLADTMTTPSGRRLAQRRTAFMRSYLEEFRHELELR